MAHACWQASLGDLMFDFVVEPHPNFTLLGRGDLGYTLNISLVEALVGFAHNVTLPNGRNVTVVHQGISPAGKLPLRRVSLTLRVLEERRSISYPLMSMHARQMASAQEHNTAPETSLLFLLPLACPRKSACPLNLALTPVFPAGLPVRVPGAGLPVFDPANPGAYRAWATARAEAAGTPGANATSHDDSATSLCSAQCTLRAGLVGACPVGTPGGSNGAGAQCAEPVVGSPEQQQALDACLEACLVTDVRLAGVGGGADVPAWLIVCLFDQLLLELWLRGGSWSVGGCPTIACGFAVEVTAS